MNGSLLHLLNGLNDAQLQKFTAQMREHKSKANYPKLIRGMIAEQSEKIATLQALFPDYSAKDLSNYKYYLKKELLHFLAVSKKGLAQKNISQVLVGNALYHDAIKILEQKIAQANKHFDYQSVVSLIHQQNEVIIHYALGIPYQKTLERNASLEKNALKQLLVINELNHLFHQLNTFGQMVGYTRRASDIEHALSLLRKNAGLFNHTTCPRCNVLMHLSLLFVANVLGDAKMAAYESDKSLRIFEQYPYMVAQYPHEYNLVLFQKALAHYNNGELQLGFGFARYFDTFKEQWAKGKTDDVVLMAMMYKGIVELIYFVYQGQFSSSKKYLYAFEDHYLKANNSSIPPYYRLLGEVVCSTLYFGMQEYKKSLHWVHRILVINRNHARVDLLRYSHLTRLLLFIELKNYQALLAVLEETYVYMRAMSEKQLHFERMLPQFFDEVANKQLDGEALAEKCKWVLAFFKPDEVVESKHFEFFLLIPWLTCKAKRTELIFELQKNVQHLA